MYWFSVSLNLVERLIGLKADLLEWVYRIGQKAKLSGLCSEFHIVLKWDGHSLVAMLEHIFQLSNMLLKMVMVIEIIRIVPLKDKFSIIETVLLSCVL